MNKKAPALALLLLIAPLSACGDDDDGSSAGGDTTITVLAALLGLNSGSGLTYTGSLATLLWRRGLVRQGVRPGMWGFHRVSLVATPLSLLAAVSVLALVT